MSMVRRISPRSATRASAVIGYRPELARVHEVARVECPLDGAQELEGLGSVGLGQQVPEAHPDAVVLVEGATVVERRARGGTQDGVVQRQGLAIVPWARP